jgi:hypothetical protein
MCINDKKVIVFQKRKREIERDTQRERQKEEKEPGF